MMPSFREGAPAFREGADHIGRARALAAPPDQNRVGGNNTVISTNQNCHRTPRNFENLVGNVLHAGCAQALLQRWDHLVDTCQGALAQCRAIRITGLPSGGVVHVADVSGRHPRRATRQQAKLSPGPEVGDQAWLSSRSLAAKNWMLFSVKRITLFMPVRVRCSDSRIIPVATRRCLTRWPIRTVHFNR
jgi:hypothetical protein